MWQPDFLAVPVLRGVFDIHEHGLKALTPGLRISTSCMLSLQVQASRPLTLQRFAQVMQQMPPDVMEFLTAELGFFDSVTGISGALYSVPKDERKAGAVRLAREVSFCLLDWATSLST